MTLTFTKATWLTGGRPRRVKAEQLLRARKPSAWELKLGDEPFAEWDSAFAAMALKPDDVFLVEGEPERVAEYFRNGEISNGFRTFDGQPRQVGVYNAMDAMQVGSPLLHDAMSRRLLKRRWWPLSNVLWTSAQLLDPTHNWSITAFRPAAPQARPPAQTA